MYMVQNKTNHKGTVGHIGNNTEKLCFFDITASSGRTGSTTNTHKLSCVQITYGAPIYSQMDSFDIFAALIPDAFVMNIHQAQRFRKCHIQK